MTPPFLKQVALHIFNKYKDSTEKLCIVLPGKRGALFLKHHLAQVYGKTIWLPEIISIEDLINSLSEMQVAEETDLICYLYESYCTCYGNHAEPFESFAKWGQLMLQDFNEIDRHLADPVQLYENLAEIKEIENWSLSGTELTDFQKNYLAFMHSLSSIYKNFTEKLKLKQSTSQGLSYRIACEKIDGSELPNNYEQFLFCGFNALNAAEIKIINHLINRKKAELLWDGDPYYINDKEHEAGLFLRRNLNLFPQKDPLFFEAHFKDQKIIDVISVPKQMGQALSVKKKIQEYIDRKIPLDKVAIVLANEKLLWPVLRQLPEGVKHLNITMEYPLKFTSTFALLNSFLNLQIAYAKQEKKQKYIYHKDLTSLLRQPLFSALIQARKKEINIASIIYNIQKRNISFIGQSQLHELIGSDDALLNSLFLPSKNNHSLCEALSEVLTDLQKYFTEKEINNETVLELEYINIFIRNMNRIADTLNTYSYFKDIKAFKQLFLQTAGTASAPFIGEPLQGLQLMGVLETRTLDFEYLILVNVNESVLPSGKSVNSFIPNDLKRAFNLPLFSDKDAVYAYHFYRLLQRSKEITITYDSETDTFGKGEKSRFISQLQLEMKKYNPEIKIQEYAAGASEQLNLKENKIEIHKTESSLKKIYEKATINDVYHGFSPSSLILFKDCPLKFYFRYGAGLKEAGTVEESAESNTFGSILHKSLEELYKDLVGRSLTSTDFESKKQLVNSIVSETFQSYFESTEIKGKNIIQATVIEAYVNRQLLKDIESCHSNSIIIKDLEAEFKYSLQMNLQGKSQTVYFKGTIDRLDTDGKQVRIVDYKNSVRTDDLFEFKGFELLFNNKKYNKQFQLFMYAWLVWRSGIPASQLKPCIIPFKKNKLDTEYITENKKPLVFTDELLNSFETEITKLITSIFDTEQCFEQTDDKDICQYCEFNAICLKNVKKTK